MTGRERKGMVRGGGEVMKAEGLFAGRHRDRQAGTATGRKPRRPLSREEDSLADQWASARSAGRQAGITCLPWLASWKRAGKEQCERREGERERVGVGRGGGAEARGATFRIPIFAGIDQGGGTFPRSPFENNRAMHREAQRQRWDAFSRFRI